MDTSKTKDTLDMHFKVKHATEALTLLYFKQSFMRSFLNIVVLHALQCFGIPKNSVAKNVVFGWCVLNLEFLSSIRSSTGGRDVMSKTPFLTFYGALPLQVP